MQLPIIETEADHNLPQAADPEQPERKTRVVFWVLFVLFDFIILTPILLVGGAWFVLNQAPSDFVPQTVVIEPGTSVQTIAQQLAEQDVVRSELMLLLALRFGVDSTTIQAGTYKITEPKTTVEIAQHLVSGEIFHDLISITFIEGMRAQEYAKRSAADLPNVTKAEFLVLTQGLEGTLFPETYFVPKEFTTQQLVTLMTSTHDTTMVELMALTSTSLTRQDAIILASIVEREANTPESMALVAGIFLNRIAIGMPLQADASIEYVLDTPLGELLPGQLAAELRLLDSPYNTYLNPGLPPTPIGNPGRVAIKAVLDPTPSEYYYYITGNDGEFYYAQTYDQHLVNIERHLR